MTVFQRSAPYVVPKPDRAYGPRHHALFRRLPRTQRVERGSVVLAHRAAQRAPSAATPR